MALRERAAAGVLSAEANVRAIEKKRPKGDELAHRPVDAALADAGSPPLHGLGQLGVNGEALWWANEGIADPVQQLGRDRRERR